MSHSQHGHQRHHDHLRQHHGRIKGHHGAAAKKTELFNLVHSDISDTATEMRALGVTEAQLAPLLDRQKAWEAQKDDWIGLDLG